MPLLEESELVLDPVVYDLCIEFGVVLEDELDRCREVTEFFHEIVGEVMARPVIGAATSSDELPRDLRDLTALFDELRDARPEMLADRERPLVVVR